MLAAEPAHLSRSGMFRTLACLVLVTLSSLSSANEVALVNKNQQSGFSRSSQQNIADYTAHLSELEVTHGTYSEELLETLKALGENYQSQSQHEKAIEQFGRAEYILRMNQGLYTEDMIPVTEALIESYEEMGRRDDANDKYLYLIFLASRVYGERDLRTVPGLASYADWQMSLFDETIRFEFDGVRSLGVYGLTDKRTQRQRAFEHLSIAAEHYGKAIQALVENQSWSDPRLKEYEKRLVEAFFLVANREALLDEAGDYLLHSTLHADMDSYDREDILFEAYKRGIDAHSRIMRYVMEDSTGNLRQYVEALLALGDWHMLFGRTSLGFSKYREARELLVDQNVSETSISEILTPAAPVILPAFVSHADAPFVQTSLATEAGKYVDVRFRLNQNGNARDIEIVDCSFELEKRVERRLKRYLQSRLFRPRFDGEDLALGEIVTVRYALND